MKTGLIDGGGKDSGYDIVPDPDMNLVPLCIVDENCNKVGKLSKYLSFPTPTDPPKIISDIEKAELKQVFVSSTDANMHISLLKNCLKWVGFDTKMEFKDTKTYDMKFTNVLSDSVMPSDLAEYIGKGKIVTDENMLKLIQRSSKSFVLYDIIKSNAISVTLKNAKGAGATTDIKAIKDVAEISSGIQMDQSGDSTLTYSSKKPLTVGIKQYGFWAGKTILGRPIVVFKPFVARGSRDAQNVISYKGFSENDLKSERFDFLK